MISKYLNLYLITTIFVILLSINSFLYFYLVPYLNLNNFSNLGFISNDSYIFHQIALDFIKSNPSLIDYISLLYNVNFHIFFLVIFYLLNLGPFYYTLLNITLVIICLFISFKIIDEKIDFNNKNQIFLAKSSFILITLFLPSNFFFYTQLGKEYFVIFSLLYLFYFLFISKSLYFDKKIIFKTIFLFFSLHILVISKDYMIFTLILSYWLLYIISRLSKNIYLNTNKLLSFKKILFVTFLVILIIILRFLLHPSLTDSNIGSTANVFDYYNVISLNIESNTSLNNFFHEDNNILDKIALPFNKIRFFLVNWSLVNEANTLISSEIPTNFIESFIVYIKSLFYSVIYPANFLLHEINILNKIAITENFIYLIIVSSIILNKNKSIEEVYLMIFFIFILSVILYLNPNIGSFYKQKSLCFYTIAIFGIMNWLKIFQYINQKYFLTFSKKKHDLNDISSISSNSFKLLIFIVTVSIFTLVRDLFIINFSTNQLFIEIFLVIILSISIISNSINIPLNELLINYYYQNKKLDIKFLVIILFFSFCINIYIYKVIINTNLYNYLYIVLLSLLFYASILINSFINCYYIYSKKILYIYLSQTISLFISFIFLFLTKENLNLLNIIISLNIWILSNILINFILVNNNYKEIINKFSYSNLNKKDLSNFLNNYFSYILLNGGVIVLILFSTISANDDYSLVVSLRIYLYMLGILIVIFNIIITPYLFKKNNIGNISNRISKFIELVLILSLLVVFIFLSSFDWLLNIILYFSLLENKTSITYISQILILGFPFVILNYFYTKQLLSINDFKSANIINLFATVILAILLISYNFNNMVHVSTFYLSINILQFLMFNYLVRNQMSFRIDFLNIFPILFLFTLFFLIKNNFIENYYIILFIPICIIFFKKKFYD